MPAIISTIILAEAEKITILVWTSVVNLNNRNVACIFSTRLYELRNSGKFFFSKRLLRANFGLSDVPSTLPVRFTSTK
jgi:hypothetical protein